MKNLIIYDTEIRHGVTTEDNPPQPGFKYADGWHDFAGMGIAVICAYDILEARYRVFMEDNFSAFEQLVDERDGVIGFNNHRFDDPLLRDNGLRLDVEKSHDLAALIWRAAGVPNGEHPKGLGLDACCKAHNLPGKTGNGADAPQDYQRGHYGRLIDYCLGDVRSTLHLLRYIERAGGIIDPRNPENFLNVQVPR